MSLTSKEAMQQDSQAQAEGLTLLVAENKTGYFGVYHQPGRSRPYKAEVRRGGKNVNLGRFATAEEAALCVARTPEGQAAAVAAAAAAVAAAAATVAGAAPLSRYLRKKEEKKKRALEVV